MRIATENRLRYIKQDTKQAFLANIWRDSPTEIFQENDAKWALIDEIEQHSNIWRQLQKWPQHALYSTVQGFSNEYSQI